MKTLIVIVAMVGVTMAAPELLRIPVTVARLSAARSVAPIGLDGRVVDTQEVLAAKAEHAAAQQNERDSLANQEARANIAGGDISEGAPIGPDGRVTDTAEVALAKAQHAAAKLSEQANLANEAARNGGIIITIAPQRAVPLITNDRLYY